tara:strand:- start:238 stop:555 length:318 start_codon:yes stop_codon:yes gene_type:complete
MKITTIHKDKRRKEEFFVKQVHYTSWKISLKYSTLLNNNVNKYNIVSNCYMVYDKFLREIKSNNIDIKNTNLLKSWITMINSLKIEKNIRMAVEQLHLTNLYKNN